MRKIIFRAHAGMCGTDTAEAMLYPADTPDSVLDDDAWRFGLEHAESYGVYHEDSFDAEYYDSLSEEEQQEYEELHSYNIEGWWEEYNPEEHDGLAVGGEWEWRE